MSQVNGDGRGYEYLRAIELVEPDVRQRSSRHTSVCHKFAQALELVVGIETYSRVEDLVLQGIVVGRTRPQWEGSGGQRSRDDCVRRTLDVFAGIEIVEAGRDIREDRRWVQHAGFIPVDSNHDGHRTRRLVDCRSVEIDERCDEVRAVDRNSLAGTARWVREKSECRRIVRLQAADLVRRVGASRLSDNGVCELSHKLRDGQVGVDICALDDRSTEKTSCLGRCDKRLHALSSSRFPKDGDLRRIASEVSSVLLYPLQAYHSISNQVQASFGHDRATTLT